MKANAIAIAISAVLPLALSAQSPGTAFQYAFTSSEPGTIKLMAAQSRSKPVTGKPVSANEVRSSLQVLGDGTRIETKTTDKFYRDDQGRTRVEREDGTVIIEDPVSGSSVEVNGNHKVVRNSTFSYSAASAGKADSAAMLDKLKAEAQMKADVQVREAPANALTAARIKLDSEMTAGYAIAYDKVATFTSDGIHKEEKLGLQVTNGISAEGTRVTTTIPQGKIGNDRDINVVSERWFSPELQMLIKSVNKDPRFGDTTYEMTNIIPGAQDPALFVAPAGKLGNTAR